MTATVISLDSRRTQREQACTCVQHQLWVLSDGVREALAQSEGELLVTRDGCARVLEDVLQTIAAAMATGSEVER